MAIAQLIYGPLSDLYGRRPVLLMGLILFSLGGHWLAFLNLWKCLFQLEYGIGSSCYSLHCQSNN